MRILRLGDPHAKPSNLVELDALMQFTIDKYKEFKADRLEILGDLYDTHDILRLSVQKFWHGWMKKFHRDKINTVILVGNHDQNGDYSDNYSALDVFEHYNHYIQIIMEPKSIGPIGYMPYIHNNERFAREANLLANVENCSVLVSHTTYQGSKYDNGMYAPDGVDPDLLSPKFIHLISGHVHTEQEFGRVWYPGTARWMSKSCANKKKGIWLVEHDDITGQILSKEFISTESVCTPIVSLTWKEGEEKPTIPQNAKVDIELIGSSNWISKEKFAFTGLASISSKTTDAKNKGKERKSGKSLQEFLIRHYECNPEKKVKLIKFMEGLKLV